MLHSKKGRSPARSENKLPCRRSFPEFFVPLTSPWILRLGKKQINLHCARLIRIFAADPAERQENGNVPAPSRTGSLTKGKHVWMMALIPRIAAVSYLNTIPFIYGIRHAGNLRAELLLTPPALCASNFIDGNADIALLPSAVVPRLKDAELVTDFCIGAEGEVRTVVVVSNTPIEEVRRIWLDAHSRTSVQLTGYLAARRWKIAPQWLDMSDYAVLDTPQEGDAFLLIGDKVFDHEDEFIYSYDLAAEWREVGRPQGDALRGDRCVGGGAHLRCGAYLRGCPAERLPRPSLCLRLPDAQHRFFVR